MKIAVVAANGRVAQKVVKEALDRGHVNLIQTSK